MKKLLCLLILGAALLLTACTAQDPAPQQPDESGQSAGSDTSKTENGADANQPVGEPKADPPSKAPSVQGQEDSPSVSGSSSGSNVSTDAQKLPGGTSAKTNAAYYGVWEITSSVCTAPVYALSSAEIEKSTGVILTYAQDSFSCGETVCDFPVYSESFETAKYFAESYKNKLTFSDLGIADDLAAAVSIENCYEFGSHFYIKDETTLVICYEGVFFEAVKK